MTDEKKQESSGPNMLGQIGLGSLISGLLAVLGSAAGAGWPGVVALVLVGLAVPFGWNILVGMANDWSDKRDQERAGADAGNTAVDLQNQGRGVSTGLDGAQKNAPPTEGFPKN